MEVEFNKKNNLTVYILLMKIKHPLLILLFFYKIVNLMTNNINKQ